MPGILKLQNFCAKDNKALVNKRYQWIMKLQLLIMHSKELLLITMIGSTQLMLQNMPLPSDLKQPLLSLLCPTALIPPHSPWTPTRNIQWWKEPKATLKGMDPWVSKMSKDNHRRRTWEWSPPRKITIASDHTWSSRRLAILRPTQATFPSTGSPSKFSGAQSTGSKYSPPQDWRSRISFLESKMQDNATYPKSFTSLSHKPRRWSLTTCLQMLRPSKWFTSCQGLTKRGWHPEVFRPSQTGLTNPRITDSREPISIYTQDTMSKIIIRSLSFEAEKSFEMPPLWESWL